MILEPFAPWLLLVALFADAFIGDPPWLWQRIPHPVVIMGRLIGFLDNNLNRETWSFATRRVAGIIALLIVMGAAAGVGMVLRLLLHDSSLGKFAEVLIVTVLLAQRSLYEHVDCVKQAFDDGGLPAARMAVSRIVGRDPEALDEAGVCRAAIESTAENFSDGIVAPAFWYLIAGLPGILAYKAVNTADSMIGHRSARYLAFGWAAARLDDLLNYIPARLSGVLLAGAAPAVGGNAKDALRAMLRDARKHRSVNAGWPEAAMAGALGLALAGPRVYAGGRVEDAWMNASGRPNAKPSDIASALRLLVATCLAHALLVAVVGLIAQLL
jgi:adenosylcobinamide-phosphate synthase